MDLEGHISQGKFPRSLGNELTFDIMLKIGWWTHVPVRMVRAKGSPI